VITENLELGAIQVVFPFLKSKHYENQL